MAVETELEMTEGIRDRIIDGLLRLWRFDIEGIRRGDQQAIRDAAKTIAGFLDLQHEAEELDEIVAEVVAHDVYGALYQLGDALMKYCGPKANPPYAVPGPKIMTGARKNIKDFTALDAAQWWEINKPVVRREADTGVCRIALRKVPEIQRALEGKASAAELTALDPDDVVKWLNRAILLLTVASAFYPPLGAVVVALKLILARYESNHPDTGLALTALAE